MKQALRIALLMISAAALYLLLWPVPIDPAARFATLTGVYETRDTLYLTSLFGNELGVVNKDDL